MRSRPCETMRTLQILAILALIYGANALDNGLARTPPMGWRSWNAYGAKINQDLMENAADMMVDNSRGFSLKGGASISPAPFAYCSFRFSDRGYTRVGLDDYYQLCGAGAGGSFHNASGYPIIDTTLFPDMRSTRLFQVFCTIVSKSEVLTCCRNDRQS